MTPLNQLKLVCSSFNKKTKANIIHKFFVEASVNMTFCFQDCFVDLGKAFVFIDIIHQ